MKAKAKAKANRHIGKVTPRKRNYEYAVRSSDAFISN